MADYDIIIVGGGHNGLVCAAYLGNAGKRVLLLEASEQLGGLASTREFYPGFSTSVAHSVSHFPQSVINDLGLNKLGFTADPAVAQLTGLQRSGDHVMLTNGEVDGVSESEAEQFARYSKLMGRFAAALEPFWLQTIPRLAPGKAGDLLTFAKMGLNLRRMGQADMREFLRIFSLPMRDLMDEYFESDTLKALLSWDGLIGSKMAPRSPNNSVLTLLYRMSASSVSGQVQNLVSALEAAAKAAGVEIRTGSPVKQIMLDGGPEGLGVKGVLLEDGSELKADQVVSSADPKTTFLDLVGAPNLEIGFTNRINRIRSNGYVAKLHLALSGLPEFTGLSEPRGRMLIADSLDAIEFAFDDSKYREISANPVIEFALPSTGNSQLAPDGQHVLSANVMYVPYDVKGGWDAEARENLAQKCINVISEYAPGIGDLVLGTEVLSPLDLEQQFGVSGGHWHHGELALDQMLMMRPTYEAAQYTTPVSGLFLCGAGCHPAGDLTGAAGHNAAKVVLK